MNESVNHGSRIEGALVWYARHFPFRTGKLRVINSLWRTAIGSEYTFRQADLTHGNYKMQCDLNQTLQRQYYFFGTYFMEERNLKCWENAAKEAEVVFDVGANAGIYSLAALAVQPEASVYAFEPTPEIASSLRATARLNGLDRLYVQETAVSNKIGQAILKRCRGDCGTNEGMNFIAPCLEGSGGEVVRTVSLDQFCQFHAIKRIDLVKIDIQGHEHFALEGARDLVRAGNLGIIFMELNWTTGPGVACPATESIRMLAESGYLFSRPGKRLDWKKPGDWLKSLRDIVARAPSKDFGSR